MLRWDWRPACERRGGVWECVCTTVLWGRGLYNDFELFFFFLGEGWYNYSTLAYLTRNPRAVCAAIFVLAHDLRTLSVAVHEIAFRRTAFATARRAAACLLRTRCGAARPSVSSWPRSRRGRRNGAAVCKIAFRRTAFFRFLLSHNVPSLGLTHPATTPVAGPMCVPNDRPLSGLP